MARKQAEIKSITPYTIKLGEKEKRIVNRVKSEYLDRTGAIISIETAVKILIRRNK